MKFIEEEKVPVGVASKVGPSFNEEMPQELVSTLSESAVSELAVSDSELSLSNNNSKIELIGKDLWELENEIKEKFNLPSFRAKQLLSWLYRRRSTDFSLMSDFSLELRQNFEQNYKIYRPKVITVQQSVDGTRKYLLEVDDHAQVETVLIKQPKRYTLCVSSQVGCAIGCKFCKTGTMGLKRNLKTHEILAQILAVQDDIEHLQANAKNPPEFFSNIVFMGMGEPLHNFANVKRAVSILNQPLGFNFSSRKITVSTSGLVPEIRKFGDEKLQANLAVSLNATTDEVRTRIMPINKRWPLNELLKTLRDFPLKNRQRITIEYVMLGGINDTEDDMKRLPTLMHGLKVKINLIPYNANAGLGFLPPERKVVAKWHEYLLNKGLSTTIRWSKGQDISAACGQLVS